MAEEKRLDAKKTIASQLGLLLAMICLAAAPWACDASEEAQRTSNVEATGEVQEFVLEGFMDGYVGVGGDIDGVQNPTLSVEVGDEVKIRLINGERMPHDIAMKKHDVTSEMLVQVGEEATIRFVAEEDDTYYCTVPGHEAAGMVGELQVTDKEAGEAVSLK